MAPRTIPGYQEIIRTGVNKMKSTRTERLIRIVSKFLLDPSAQHSLTEMSEKFGISKTVVSDDVGIIDKALSDESIGRLEVERGRSGGAAFRPLLSEELRRKWLEEIVGLLNEPGRLLPGMLVYYSDILFNPSHVRRLGFILASDFYDLDADIVMTSEMKGIPLAMFTAHALGIPLAVCRFRNRPSDGPAVAVHYQAANGDIRTMYMGTRHLSKGKRVLLIDDFMRGGSTASGMLSVAREFEAIPVGVGVFIASSQPESKAVDNYKALLRLDRDDSGTLNIAIEG
jgi:purine operon repressor